MRGTVILCGGRSTRMGRSKAWLRFGSETFLERIARIATEAGSQVLVVAAPDQDLPPLPPEILLARDVFEGQGPLNGFEAGLLALPPFVEAIFLTSCDAPLLEPQFVRRTLALLGSHDIAIPLFEGHPQPLAAAYRVDGLLARIERVRSSGKSGLIDLLPDADVRFIAPDELRDVDPKLDSLRNINTPEEYAAAIRSLEMK